MILVFDVGNTELTIGLFSESELRGHWRVMTDVARTPDEFGVLLRALLAARGLRRRRRAKAWRSARSCRA